MRPWTDLGDGIHVRQSRAYWMNSGLLLHPDHAVILDPGVLPSELEELARAVAEVRPRAVTLVFTHSHWDHVLGRPWWPEAATAGHARLGPALWRDPFSLLQSARACATELGERWEAGFEPFDPDLPLEDGARLERGPWVLVARGVPGHCDDQLAFHLPERRMLFAADLLSDIEIPWLDRGPAEFRRSLEALRQLTALGEVETLVPGHGSVAHGARAVLERLERDLDYLARLAAGAGAARAEGLDLDETRERLAAMEYTGRGAEYSMDEVHRENVRFAWEEAGAPEG